MRERVLGSGEGGGTPGSPFQGQRSAWEMLFGVGAVLAVVGWIDIALIWYPARWASIDWEFGSISATFDALPLATIGLCLATASAVARERVGWMRAGAAALLVLALVWIVIAVVLALDVPVVLSAVRPEMKPVLRRAITKTVTIAVCYIGLYALLGVWTLRRARNSARGA